MANVHQVSVTFLGFEFRGGNVYPPQQAIQRLKEALRVRGNNDRVNLMRSFVNRFRIGPIRKLLRRIDRDVEKYRPAGLSLTGIFDGVCSVSYSEVFEIPRGTAACNPAKKARVIHGQSPVAVAAGGQVVGKLAPSPQWKVLVSKKLMRSSTYLAFIRDQVCSFCESVQTEPHHAIRTFEPVGSGGVGLRGSDFLVIPLCRTCHVRIHSADLHVSEEQVLEIIVRNLVVFSAELAGKTERTNR